MKTRLAARLLLASLLFSYVWRWVSPLLLRKPTGAKSTPLYAQVVVGVGLLGLCYAVHQGKRWAAWLFALVFALEVLLPAVDYKRLLANFQQQPLDGLSFPVTYLLQGWALWLLFKRE